MKLQMLIVDLPMMNYAGSPVKVTSIFPNGAEIEFPDNGSVVNCTRISRAEFTQMIVATLEARSFRVKSCTLEHICVSVEVEMLPDSTVTAT